MERVVFVGGIIFAILAAFVFMAKGAFHGGRMVIIDHVTDAEEIHEVAAEQIEERVYAAGSLQLDHIAARVVITPEARADIAIAIDNPGHLPTPVVTVAGGEIEIDGRLRGRVGGDCDENNVHVGGYGEFAGADLPVIRVRTPMNVSVEMTGASLSEIAPAEAVHFVAMGCGTAQIGNVTGLLDVEFGGMGEVRAGDAGELRLVLPGAGDVELGAVNGDADISVYGTGEVDIGSVTGELRSEIGGDGTIHVARGTLSRADISIGGVGEFELGEGAIEDANVSIGGDGHVRFPGPVSRLEVSLGGAGEVEVDGDVGDLNANIAGVGQVRVGRVTGRLEKQVVGIGGGVEVGN